MSSSAGDVDFICLGAGIGGLAAAIRAHDLGLSTIILEESDQLGGVAAYSSGQQWAAGNHLAREAGLEDSWEAGLEYLTWLADGTADLEMLETFCRIAPEAFEYFDREAGVRWCLFDLPDNYWPDAPGTLPTGRFIELEPFDGQLLPDEYRDIVRHSPTSLYSNHEVYHEMGGNPHRGEWDPEVARERTERDVRYQGSALAAYFVMAAYERTIPILTNVEVTDVIVEDGAVAGVTARVDGEEREFRASKGVLFAMGGYDWSGELVQKFDKRSEFGSRAPRSVTGDHFSLLAGLEPAIWSAARGHGVGFLEPAAFTGDSADRWMAFYCGWPHAIVVNADGKRFAAESNPGGCGGPEEWGVMNQTFDRRTGEALNWPCFGIFDSQYRSKYTIGTVRPDDETLPDCFVSAATPAELAEKLGIDVAGLEQTIASFNEHALEGRDPEFQRGENVWARSQFGDPWMKPNENLGTVEEAPFFGVELSLVGVALTQTGLLTDGAARVVNERGEVIRNLYAVGNSMAWRDLGWNYHSGSANTRGMTWGYIVASHVAGVDIGPRPFVNAE